MYKITPSIDSNYWLKSLETTCLYYPISFKYLKFLTKPLGDCNLEILGTSVIFSPMSPP